MMAKQLKPFDQRAAAYPPNSVIERSRQILVAERPAVRPSANRAPAHPAPMAHLSRAQLEAAKAAGKAAAAAAPKLYATLLVYCPPRPQRYPHRVTTHRTQCRYNSVVRIDGEEAHPYWYVLTYLPDLQWCHVAPLERRGVFPADAGVSAGRPRWMLVPEDAGAEMDCGAARCHIMDALEKKKTKENADEEEWDIRCEA